MFKFNNHYLYGEYKSFSGRSKYSANLDFIANQANFIIKFGKENNYCDTIRTPETYNTIEDIVNLGKGNYGRTQLKHIRKLFIYGKVNQDKFLQELDNYIMVRRLTN